MITMMIMTMKMMMTIIIVMMTKQSCSPPSLHHLSEKTTALKDNFNIRYPNVNNIIMIFYYK